MKTGIIGGSGLEKASFFKKQEELVVNTAFGKPSSPITKGIIGHHEVFLLVRHGPQHTIIPSEINNRANILALKDLGCTHIIATTAVGSLQEKIAPGHFVVLDQFIDRTTQRASTLYPERVCHIPLGEPFCPTLRKKIIAVLEKSSFTYHPKGMVITIEGPRFSTKAESFLFRSWHADVINMSTVPEVVLAREAGMCYASIAMSTDYDCWHESKEPVTIDMVLATMKKNSERVQQVLFEVITHLEEDACSCREMY